MANTFYNNIYKKIKPDILIEEKEQIIYEQLMKTDRVFVRNMREGDLFSVYGGETAHQFIQKIQMQEMTVGRRLNPAEIEDTYQQMLEGLQKWMHQ
jgi:hypothetical protein